MFGAPFSPNLRLTITNHHYALSGVQMIFLVPPTFIPGIPSSQAGMTILCMTKRSVYGPHTNTESERHTNGIRVVGNRLSRVENPSLVMDVNNVACT